MQELVDTFGLYAHRFNGHFPREAIFHELHPRPHWGSLRCSPIASSRFGRAKPLSRSNPSSWLRRSKWTSPLNISHKSAPILTGAGSKPTCLTFLTLPPCDCTVPEQWRLVAFWHYNHSCLLTYLLTITREHRSSIDRWLRILSLRNWWPSSLINLAASVYANWQCVIFSAYSAWDTFIRRTIQIYVTFSLI